MAISNGFDSKKLLSITNNVIEKLEKGILFRTLLSWMMQWVVVFLELAVVIGILTTIYAFFQSNQGINSYTFQNFLLTLWNIVVLIAFGIVSGLILFYRSKRVKESPEGRIIPLVAQLFRCYGELIAVAIITIGLSSIGGMFGGILHDFTPFGGMAGGSQALVQSVLGFGTFASFIGWLFVVIVSVLIAVLVLAGAYFTAEVTMLLVDIAENTKKASKG
jgi:hypothetical protein